MDECVYEARHGFEAQLLKDLLAQDGICAELRGDYLQGGVGELPAIGLVQLRVDSDQADAARALLARWEAGEMALPDDEPPPRRPADDGRPRVEPGWLMISLLPLLLAATALALAD